MKKINCCLFFVFILSACGKDPKIEDSMLDGGLIFDQSLYQPEDYLISASKPNPTADDLLKPVVIAIHGYTATTFEWTEFKTWASNRTDFLISRVLLGGHGRDFQSFKNASWQDWQKPIIEEFEKLESKGYKSISFAGSSTGCTLILEMLANGYFKNHIKPRHIFLIDPIVIPSNKLLSLANVVGPIIGYTTSENTQGEEKFYYHYRPQETLEQLRELTNKVRRDLEKGIKLPEGSTLKVFKSEKDDAADPVSAVLIYKGVKTHSGGLIDVSMVESDLHVYTRLDFRSPTPSAKDIQNQKDTFTEIANRMVK